MYNLDNILCIILLTFLILVILYLSFKKNICCLKKENYYNSQDFYKEYFKNEKRRRQPICCNAMTPTCEACKAGISVEEYLRRYPDTDLGEGEVVEEIFPETDLGEGEVNEEICGEYKIYIEDLKTKIKKLKKKSEYSERELERFKTAHSDLQSNILKLEDTKTTLLNNNEQIFELKNIFCERLDNITKDGEAQRIV